MYNINFFNHKTYSSINDPYSIMEKKQQTKTKRKTSPWHSVIVQAVPPPPLSTTAGPLRTPGGNQQTPNSEPHFWMSYHFRGWMMPPASFSSRSVLFSYFQILRPGAGVGVLPTPNCHFPTVSPPSCQRPPSISEVHAVEPNILFPFVVIHWPPFTPISQDPYIPAHEAISLCAGLTHPLSGLLFPRPPSSFYLHSHASKPTHTIVSRAVFSLASSSPNMY